MRKILLTGAAGFIGYHLAEALCALGDEVVGFDNFNSYYDPLLKRERAKRLNISLVEGDICDTLLLEQVASTVKPTHVVHLAAQAGVRYSIENPSAYVKSNLEGFVSLLEVCRKRPKVPLIYASSSSVYGMNAKLPFSVEDRTDEQVSLYGATKKSNELLALSYHHLYGIPVTGLRFFTVYGPWGRPDMAYFSFTKSILEGRPIQVFNHGKLQRDFTYITDIVEGTIQAIEYGAAHEIFNLGNHQPVTLQYFIQTIEEAVGKRAVCQNLPMQAGDVLATYADIQHSQKCLGFSPKTSLQKGIAQFVQWYKSYYR